MKAPLKPACAETANARVILEHARGTVKAFDEAFSGTLASLDRALTHDKGDWSRRRTPQARRSMGAG
jgi:hypothetical protein